jgi:NAD(P)-dependent dehydrogenase (short-subunit alcohol dehydrogenase family)
VRALLPVALVDLLSVVSEADAYQNRFNCMRAELNVMTSGGSIVNAASVAGLMGLPHMAAYCASKHAVVGLTKTAAKEYGGQGIRVNAIAPGIISTPMTDTPEARESLSGQVVPLGGRKGDPSEVGNLIGFLLSDDASYISGSVMQIDGAWQA